MTIQLPNAFKALSNSGRVAFQPEERVGHVGEQATLAENDHYLRSQGVIRNGLTSQSYEPIFGGADTQNNGHVFYSGRIKMTDGRTRLKFWSHIQTGLTLNLACACALKYKVFSASTAALLYSYTTPNITVVGHQLTDTHTTPNLAVSDVYVEVTAVVLILSPQIVLKLIGSSIYEDPMTVAEL